MNLPYSYDYQNIIDARCNPSGVTVTNTATANFFRRYLLQKAISVFRWEMPETWSKDYFLYTLYCNGSIAIVKTDRFGVIPQGGQPFGYNVFYQPYQYSIANPLIQGIKQPVIGKQCIAFKCTRDWGGIMDLVGFYGDYMALAAQALGVNLINSKLAYAFGAKNKATAESIKKAADQVEGGKPFVVVDKDLFNADGKLGTTFFTQNLKQTFLAPDVLDVMRTVEDMFCTAVGIPNANQNKKERMIVDEVNANNTETETMADSWLEGWKQSCKAARDMFGVEISVDWRDKRPEGGANDGKNGNAQLHGDV